MTNEAFIEKLNNDLSNEYAAIIQYITYAAKVTGPFRLELSKFLMAEVADEQQHAKFLADKIMTLGGKPTTKASSVPEASDAKSMLQEVMKAEERAIEAYTERAEEAIKLGLKSLSLDLEDMIRDETNHREETEKILKGWHL